jgi:hypothetical protein
MRILLHLLLVLIAFVTSGSASYGDEESIGKIESATRRGLARVTTNISQTTAKKLPQYPDHPRR